MNKLIRDKSRRKLRQRIFDRISEKYEKICYKMENSEKLVKKVIAGTIYMPYCFSRMGVGITAGLISVVIPSKRLKKLSSNLVLGTRHYEKRHELSW